MSLSTNTPSYLVSILQNKCPRCRKGDLFVSKAAYNLKNGENVKMNDRCPICNQQTEIEVGFYYGTSYVSYALTVAFSGLSFAVWFFTIGFNLDDNRIFWWLGLNAFVLLVMQPLFMRISRTMWISWFVDYDPEWQQHQPKDSERVVQEHMKNW